MAAAPMPPAAPVTSAIATFDAFYTPGGTRGGMMASMPATSAVERIRTERAIAVLRRVPEAELVVDELVAGGIAVVEITSTRKTRSGRSSDCARATA
jgi:hypothetical protein